MRGFPQDSTLQRTVGYDVRKQTQVQSYPGYQARPYAGTMPQCGAPSLPPPASSFIPPTFPSGPLDPLAVGRGCLLCNAPCPNKWNAFCCADHRAKYFDAHLTNCRQCCCMGQYIDRSSGMRYFRDEVCSYCCGVFSKFRLPERVTAQNIELYNRETSSLHGQEALRQLKRQVPPEFVCLGCRAVPSAPWSLFCSEDCRTRKSLALHHLCLHCFQRPRMPNSAACSEECTYCLTYGLPGRATMSTLKSLDEFRGRLRRDMELDARKKSDPEATELPQKKETCLKCTKPLSLPDPQMDSVVRLNCGHEFHSACIHEHLRTQPQGNFCPVCGEKFANVDMSQNPVAFAWLTTAVSLRRLEDYK